MLKAVIIDDEQDSRESLAGYVQKYCDDVVVVGFGQNVETGIAAIKEFAPDIVFLDVEMPYGNAFDLLEKFDEITFETIFVTAFSDYAIKALNFSASYYLLKPVDIDELVSAIDKIKKERAKNEVSFHTKILIENIQNANKQLHKIILPLADGFEIVRVNEIVRCQANDNLTDFHLKDGRKLIICRTLKHYEELLKEFGFMRVHRSHLINLEYVTKYTKGKGGYITLENGTHVDVSSTAKKGFIERFFG